MSAVVALEPDNEVFSAFLNNVLANSKPVLDQGELVKLFRKASELIVSDEVAADIMMAYDQKYQEELKVKGRRDNQDMIDIFHSVADETVGESNIDKLKGNVERLHAEKVDEIFRDRVPTVTQLARSLFDGLSNVNGGWGLVDRVAKGKLKVTIGSRDPQAEPFTDAMYGRHSAVEPSRKRIFLCANGQDANRPGFLAGTFIDLAHRL